MRKQVARFALLPWARVAARMYSVVALTAGCGDPSPSVLTADMPLHLEDHLDAAVVEGSLPVNPPATVEWHFDEPQPDWKPIVDALATTAPRVERTTDALRVALAERTNGQFRGGVYVELPDWHEGEWTQVIVRARTSSNVRNIGIGRNQAEIDPGEPLAAPLNRLLGGSPLVSDDLVHTYQIRLTAPGLGIPWQRLGLWVQGDEPGSIDILSVSVVPKGAEYAATAHGVLPVSIRERIRRTLYTHAPGRFSYPVRIPEGGRLDASLGVLGDVDPVTFRVSVRASDQDDVLFEERYADPEQWGQRSVDLSRFAGQTVTLSLETNAEQAGTVAFWGAPTVSGARRTDKPNVILYIIDGGGADYMSAYGYNRRTTPNLERIAAEGALFERAYSNAYWTTPSTASFVTSLYHSVLGGVRENNRNPLPSGVTTIAEHMHRARYQTAELTSNPNAGRFNSIERGHDTFLDAYFGRVASPSISSVALHADFWQWRTAYPSEPYYVHFQTTDVHLDHDPVAPFAGLFISADRRQLLDDWEERLDPRATESGNARRDLFESAGVNWVDYFAAQRDLHDETMAHQDHQLGRLVARLKANGEWERTVLIVAADHGVSAGAYDYELLMLDLQRSAPDTYTSVEGGHAAAMLASGVSHIPLVVIWPGHIAPGQRFTDPVSMIDVLPTILDLVDLPLPDVMQGQSLAPLLLGEGEWEPRPIILDEFNAGARTGALRGRIEVIDGRWGASLQITPSAPDDWGNAGAAGGLRPAPLLLFDLWDDPLCLNSVHEQHPDLVEKYTKLLEEQFAANLALGRHLTPSEASPLTPEQLESLRSLGYIR